MVCHGMSFSHLLPSCKAPTSNIHRSTWSRFPDFFGTALLRQGCTCGGKQGVNGTQPPRITSDIGHPWVFHDLSMATQHDQHVLSEIWQNKTWPNCSLVFSLNPIQWHRFVGKWAIYTQSMAILIRKMRFLCFELFKHPWDFGVLPWFYHHFEVLNPQCWTKSQVWCSCRSVPPQCRDSPHRSARWSCWGPRPWKWNSWDLWKSHLFGLIFLFFLYEKNWSNKWENWSRLLWKDGGKRVEEIEILSSGTDLAS